MKERKRVKILYIEGEIEKKIETMIEKEIEAMTEKEIYEESEDGC